MRGRMLVLCGALAIAGCTDENNAEGSYRVDLYDRHDGCGFGWTPGGSFSTVLTVAQYEDDEREQVLAVLGRTPVDDFLDVSALVFGGEVVNGELVAYSYGQVETDTCYYFYSVEIRAEVRPNRFKNLLGQVSYSLSTFPNSPGCLDDCVSFQDLEGEQL